MRLKGLIVHYGGLVRRFATCVLAIGGITMALAAGYAPDEDYRQWVKLEVKEAFISRQTTIDYKDANSPAEFGWHVSVGGTRLGRGNNIYATLYYPAVEGAPVRLTLVEVDAFFDDTVGGVDLKKDVNKYTFTTNGDWAIIERTLVYPDASSGPDARPAGARRLSGDVTDSVSFAAGDHTDYYLVPKGGAAIVLAEHFNGDLTAPKGGLRIMPERHGMKSVFIVAADDAEALLRLQSTPGGGTQAYRLLYAQGPGRAEALLDKAVAHLSSLAWSQGMFVGDDMARAFMEFAPQAAQRRCATPAVKKITAKRLVEFCAGVQPDRQ